MSAPVHSLRAPRPHERGGAQRSCRGGIAPIFDHSTARQPPPRPPQASSTGDAAGVWGNRLRAAQSGKQSNGHIVFHRVASPEIGRRSRVFEQTQASPRDRSAGLGRPPPSDWRIGAGSSVLEWQLRRADRPDRRSSADGGWTRQGDGRRCARRGYRRPSRRRPDLTSAPADIEMLAANHPKVRAVPVGPDPAALGAREDTPRTRTAVAGRSERPRQDSNLRRTV